MEHNISKTVLAIDYGKQKHKPTKEQFVFMSKHHPEIKKVFKFIEEMTEQERIYNEHKQRNTKRNKNA